MKYSERNSILDELFFILAWFNWFNTFCSRPLEWDLSRNFHSKHNKYFIYLVYTHYFHIDIFLSRQTQ